jgi:hypothetical protein
VTAACGTTGERLAIQVAIIAGLTAAFFTDRLYGESGYWMIGLAYALTRIQMTDAAEASEPAPSVQPAIAPVGSRLRLPTFAGAHSR